LFGATVFISAVGERSSAGGGRVGVVGCGLLFGRIRVCSEQWSLYQQWGKEVALEGEEWEK